MAEGYANRHRADARELEAFLADIGDRLRLSTNAFLIGGCNMALRGLKDATKDMDAIVETRKERNELARIMKQMGYERFMVDPFTRSVPREYEGFNGDLYRKDRAVGLDVFERIVMAQFQLTEGMKQRVTELRTYGNLHLHMISNEDLCLFKAITNRPDDDEDVMILIAQGLDVSALRQALQEQPPRAGSPWIEYVAHQLAAITTRAGVDVPWIDRLSRPEV